MKPEQFIREYGVEKAREVLAKDQFVADLCLITPSGKLIYYKKVKGSFPEVTDFGKAELTADDYFMLELTDLKRLIESLDIINDLGGIKKLTPYFITTDKHVGYTHVLKHFSGALRLLDEYWDSIPELAISIKRVITAIRDHESIYGGGDE